jgi:hypothetical protein
MFVSHFSVTTISISLELATKLQHHAEIYILYNMYLNK